FSNARCVVDVGGGLGELIAGILAKHTQLRGILFDLENVVSSAQPLLSAAGVLERCTIVPGSFLESVPPGGDLYIMKAVLHNWSDELASSILGNCRGAMTIGAKLLLAENVIKPGK